MAIVTLLTDFGTRDSYVGEMKGALLSRAPSATITDITHHLEPGNVGGAQYILNRAWAQFPRGAIHVAIVDPGVGTERRALVVEHAGHFFLAPDNGLLSFLPSDAHYYSLAIPVGAAATFHGRDVFAPAAASLVLGEPIASLGTIVTHPVRVPIPEPRIDGGVLVGVVVHVDYFGTLISNIPQSLIKGATRIAISGRAVGPLRRTFADVARGELVAFVGSGGTVEVAVRDGNAAEKLGIGVGAELRLEA